MTSIRDFLDSRKEIYSKLGLTIILYLFISFAIAAVLGVITYLITESTVISITRNEAYFNQEINDTIADLQNYITVNEISADNHDAISAWNDAYWYVMIRIYNQDGIIYDSLFYQPSVYEDSQSSAPEIIFSDGLDYKYGYDITFTDTKGKVIITALFQMRYELVIKYGCYIFTFVVCILIFMTLLKKKIRYINLIEKGIKIIESGGLKYRIPLQDDDELTSLAISINDMSRAMQERLEWEEKAKKENYDMITAISHDIRTPLTSVICYLDLLADGKYDSPAMLRTYLENAKNKAYQIKGLADNLFEHSLVTNEEIPFKYETVNGNELMAQFISDCIYVLEEKGFTVEYEDKTTSPYTLSADVQQLGRVFDNLCSNIMKYAEKETPVSFSAKIIGQELMITQGNQIAAETSGRDSSGIGIQTCKKILARHDGTLTITKAQKYFSVLITLPIQQNVTQA